MDIAPKGPTTDAGADVLAFGFGTAVATWAVAYITHLPVFEPIVPPLARQIGTFVLIIAAVFVNGYHFGRLTDRTWRGGLVAALLAATVNLLVVGSVIADADSRRTMMIGLPGYYAAFTALFLFARTIGVKRRPAEPADRNWSLALALVVVAATALVVIAGGLVTGHSAGFSVYDWPTSEGSNMFLYPLSKMVGGIFYEHTHRLFGTLVGVCAIALMIHRWVVNPRMKSSTPAWLATIALVMVCVQGLIGGLWVVEGAETPDDKPLALVVFHGTFGQLVLATFAVLAAMLTRTWRNPTARIAVPSIITDRVLASLAVAFLMLQLVLGVVLRKANVALIEHIVFAFITAVVIIGLAVRANAKHGPYQPTLRRFGSAVSFVLITQIALGFAALMVRQTDAPDPEVGSAAVSSPVDAFITTLHQSTGAALLCVVAVLAAFSVRLLKPQSADATGDAGVGQANT